MKSIEKAMRTVVTPDLLPSPSTQLRIMVLDTFF